MGTTTYSVGHEIVESNWEADPAIEKTYLFPSSNEVRLIHVDASSPAMRKGEPIAPFYFSPDRAHGIPFPLAVAIIRPDEVPVTSPPEGWGDWDTAEVIERDK